MLIGTIRDDIVQAKSHLKRIAWRYARLKLLGAMFGVVAGRFVKTLAALSHRRKEVWSMTGLPRLKLAEYDSVNPR